MLDLLESSHQLTMEGYTSCWYAQMTPLFQPHGFGMDRLPPCQHALDAHCLSLTWIEITKLIRLDLMQLIPRRHGYN